EVGASVGGHSVAPEPDPNPDQWAAFRSVPEQRTKDDDLRATTQLRPPSSSSSSSKQWSLFPRQWEAIRAASDQRGKDDTLLNSDNRNWGERLIGMPAPGTPEYADLLDQMRELEERGALGMDPELDPTSSRFDVQKFWQNAAGASRNMLDTATFG